jgi:non-specific serine/threonine protein kinase
MASHVDATCAWAGTRRASMADRERSGRWVPQLVLPVFLNRFVGRAADVTAVADLLDLHRMVTLIAPGGLGKTRLAVRVAEHTAGRWKGRTSFADYSGVTDAGAVMAVLVSVYGPSREPGEPLADRIPREPSLLLIDGCEGVLPAIREVAVELLQVCPRLHILATTRERLDIAGEVLYPVLPLSTPRHHVVESIDALRHYEAVTLFEERAAASQPGFAISGENADVVLRLCAQLEGIPLALELAAARLRMMSLLDVESHLADRFRLLTGGTGRHESVRTTIDWSYRFLDEAERLQFRRLSVFPSGFRLDAAAAVLDDEGMDLVDALGRLVDKSLLKARTDVDGRTRYHMLETIRHYAFDLLLQSDEYDNVMARSMEHFLALCEEAAAMAEAPDWQAWLDRLEAEHDNLLAVLAWTREREHHGLPALAIALGWFWQRQGDPAEGRRWLEVARAHVGDDRGRLLVLRWGTGLAAQQNDIRSALAWAEEALELAERLGDRIESAHARLALGNLMFHQQQVTDWSGRAAAHYEAAMALYDEASLAFRYIAVVLNLSLLDLARGDVAAGRRHATIAAERARAGRWPHWEWRARVRFGIAAFLDGDDDDAESEFADCFRYGMKHPEFGSRTRGVLNWLAATAARRGEHERSARLAGAAQSMRSRDSVESFMPRELTGIQDEWQDRVREVLGSARYERQVEAGRKLPHSELRRLALRDGGEETGQSTSLSARELQVVELVAEGLTNREVSGRLHLSPRTIDAHLDHVRNKLGVRTRAQLVRWLMESRQSGGQRDHDGILSELDVPAALPLEMAPPERPPPGGRPGAGTAS